MNNFGIKRTCDNCAESCFNDNLPDWKCKILFRPTTDALKEKIREQQTEIERLKKIAQIDELKKLLREHIAYLAMILRSRNDNI